MNFRYIDKKDVLSNDILRASVDHPEASKLFILKLKCFDQLQNNARQ